MRFFRGYIPQDIALYTLYTLYNVYMRYINYIQCYIRYIHWGYIPQDITKKVLGI